LHWAVRNRNYPYEMEAAVIDFSRRQAQYGFNSVSAACCEARGTSALARRQVAGEGVFVEQDFDEIDSAGQVGVSEHGVEFGLGFDAVMLNPE